MLDTNTLPALVDELTSLNTQIAVLTAQADAIKADLASTGMTEVCGSNTRAVISYISAGFSTSWKDLAQSLQPTPEQVAKFQKETAAQVRISIKGYNARKAA